MVPSPVELNLYEWSDTAEDLALWEVSCPYKRGLYWSIQIPFLMEAAVSGNFVKHFSIFIGEKKGTDTQNLEKKIKNINPFKSIDAVYKDKEFSRLMQNFKKRLNKLTQDLTRKTHEKCNDFLKFQAAANALKCFIYLCNEESNHKQMKCFTPAEINSYEKNYIKIFIIRRFSDETSKYGYGFKSEKTEECRKKSLRHILKLAKINQSKIEEVINLWPCNQLILKLLENSIKDVISKVYELPFILKKLNEASFDMNPLSTGEDGFTAFHHCILLNDWHLFIILYNHAIKQYQKNCSTSDYILLHLKSLHDLFRKEKEKYQNSPSSSAEHTKVNRMYLQVECFNEYQFRMLESIFNEKNPENPENVILHFINNYLKFFNYSNYSMSCQNIFEDFCERYEYYEILDDYTCLQFFDYFLLLKVQTDDESKLNYINVLTSILWFFLSRINFQISHNELHNGSTNSMGELFTVFRHRLKWKNSLTVLMNNLGRPPSPTSDSLHVSQLFIKFLNSNPLLKDHFQLLRLKQYFKIGIEASFDNHNSNKAALIIERTLQVIGEIISQSKQDNCYATSLLKYCLPLNLQKGFVEIRNRCLSHCSIYFVEARSYLKQEQIIKSVQDDLKKMEGAFESIFRIQNLRVKNEILTQSLQESDTNNEVKTHLTSLIEETVTLQKVFYKIHKNEYFTYIHKIFDALLQNFDYWDNGGKENFQKDFNVLNYLLIFIAENSEDLDFDTFSNVSNKIENAIETKEKIESIKLCLEELKVLLKAQNTDFIVSNSLVDEDFPSFIKLFKNMENMRILTFEEQKIVCKSLLKNSKMAKQRLIDHYRKKLVLSTETVKQLWRHFLIENNTKRDIKKKIKKKCDEAIRDIENANENINLLLGEDKNISYEIIKIVVNADYIDTIPNLLLTKSLHDKFSRISSKRLYFVNERILQLREILISDNKFISAWDRSAYTEESKNYTENSLIKRYMTEMDTKAAVEMILLDCFEVFNEKDFDELVKKTSAFFYGTNLRNFFSHGYPILELSCDLLDPTNLAREIIRKSLDLIEEHPSISALIEFWERKQYPTKEKLQEFLTSENIPKNDEDIINQIKKSQKWENYLKFFQA